MLRELRTGSKGRTELNKACQDETGANADSVYKSALQPLKNEGVITPHKTGNDGRWYWSISKMDVL